MRKAMDEQMRFGEVDISQIVIDPRLRDEIPQLLRGLQHIYSSPELRGKVFAILEAEVARRASAGRGRPGMDLWKVLVLGVLRLNCDWDFDKLQFMAETNVMIANFLGHAQGPFGELKARYPAQTLRDNLAIMTPEALERISKVVVDAGHASFKKKEDELFGKCDSYVLEINAHFPTDLSLLFDAVRKAVEIAADIADGIGSSIWRQSAHNVEKARALFNKARRASRFKGKDDGARFKDACADYIAHAEEMVSRALATLTSAPAHPKTAGASRFAAHAMLQIDQMRRRLLGGETIPHDEKVFSVFEEHTEWISKGKAGKPQELGVRVCVLQDQLGFILHHKVMWKMTDEKVAVEVTERAKELFDLLRGCSYDKGFHSPEAQERIKKIIDEVVLPKKGKLNEAEKARESSAEFVAARKAHPAIESAINALENHGLDRCPDRGVDALERYVAWGVLGRNLQILGAKLAEGERKTKGRRAVAFAVPATPPLAA